MISRAARMKMPEAAARAALLCMVPLRLSDGKHGAELSCRQMHNDCDMPTRAPTSFCHDNLRAQITR